MVSIGQQAADASPVSDKDYLLFVAFESAEEKDAWIKSHGFPEGMKIMAYKEMAAAIAGEGTRREVTQ